MLIQCNQCKFFWNQIKQKYISIRVSKNAIQFTMLGHIIFLIKKMFFWLMLLGIEMKSTYLQSYYISKILRSHLLSPIKNSVSEYVFLQMEDPTTINIITLKCKSILSRIFVFVTYEKGKSHNVAGTNTFFVANTIKTILMRKFVYHFLKS